MDRLVNLISAPETTPPSTSKVPATRPQAPVEDDDTTMSDTTTDAASSEHEGQDEKHLLGLPRELRDKIWAYALSSPNTVWWPHASMYASPPNITPALLATCRSVYSEAAPILYSENRFMFTHPSDANMFTKIHSVAHAKDIREVYLRVRDRDVRLWMTYLGSTSAHRSLLHDFPGLKGMWIFFRGNFWSPRQADLLESFRQWPNDPAMREVCLNLEGRVPPGTDVRLVCVHRLPREHIRTLLGAVPGELVVSQKGAGGEARTQFRQVKGAWIALELCVSDAASIL